MKRIVMSGGSACKVGVKTRIIDFHSMVDLSKM